MNGFTEADRTMSAIGTKRTCASAPHMSAIGGKADMTFFAAKCPLLTQSGHVTSSGMLAHAATMLCPEPRGWHTLVRHPPIKTFSRRRENCVTDHTIHRGPSCRLRQLSDVETIVPPAGQLELMAPKSELSSCDANFPAGGKIQAPTEAAVMVCFALAVAGCAPAQTARRCAAHAPS